ncbi:uncharacterized protein LOC107998122 isoform X4 [Apis cerana]|uniref:uncharacterized protein LOC107998122 isoform X4 n=1 Tax=Apis cerana TaxID=7461 RepID=UPI002B236DB8|nr:uncharacterized protein LOC107998122 isoform X4 [Apis cerana]
MTNTTPADIQRKIVFMVQLSVEGGHFTSAEKVGDDTRRVKYLCIALQLQGMCLKEPHLQSYFQVLAQYSQQCSSFCICDTWNSLKRASCVGRHLYNIDAGAPNNVQALDLSDNVISFLNSFELKELTLDSCRISHLPLDIFNGLTHIRRLDLSNNLMIQMSKTVVQRLHFLKKLSLEGNPWSCNNVLHDLQIYLKYKNIEFNEICGKKNNSQKFEKMILLPVTLRNYHHSAIMNTSTKKIKSITKYNISNILNNKNLSICEQMINQTHIINSTDKFVSYCFLCLGFIAGISSGLIISYIWLSRKYSYNPRYWYRGQLHDDLIVSQRMSLLNSFSQGRTDSNGSLIESCPGTPPPPYRDVILRPTLYCYPSVVSNLNNNDTRYRERYT